MQMNVDQQNGKETKLERAGYAALDALTIAYFPQHVIGDKFCVDAFVPSLGIVIQFDGDYWHGNPAKFATLDARQRRRARLDHSQDAYMSKCGFHVLRFWESDIKANANVIAERLQPFLTPQEPMPVFSA